MGATIYDEVVCHCEVEGCGSRNDEVGRRCEERSDEAILVATAARRLLRYARNDEVVCHCEVEGRGSRNDDRRKFS